MRLRKTIEDHGYENQGRSQSRMQSTEKIAFFCWACIFALIVLALASCFPNKKFAKAVNTFDSEPEKAAWYCATKFPVKDTVIYRDSVSFDTVYEIDSYYDTTTIHDTVVQVKTSPAKVVVKTVYKIKEVVRENTAKVQALQLSLANATNLIAKREDEISKCYEGTAHWKGLAKKRFWWLLIAVGAAGGWVLRKPLLKLIKPV